MRKPRKLSSRAVLMSTIEARTEVGVNCIQRSPLLLLLLVVEDVGLLLKKLEQYFVSAFNVCLVALPGYRAENRIH